MTKLKNITVLKGDGIGPEVIDQAILVLESIGNKYGHKFDFEEQLIGAAAIDATGSPLPEQTLNSCKKADAVLLGAVGHPKYDHDPKAKIRPEQGLLDLRKKLGLYANVRPIRIFESLMHLSVIKPHVLKGVDMVIYRELTGGIYFGKKKRKKEGASDQCVYYNYEIERIAKLAFEEAMMRKRKLCLIDKANVLETSRLWRDIIMKMGLTYPEIEISYLYIDNAAMQMIINPIQFDVIVTSNMFGDIISDEASVLGGSIGTLPSSSAGEKHRLYEPVHGSFSPATGLDIANPIAAILSVEMMLRDFRLFNEANDILYAVEKAIDHGFLTQDLIKTNPKKCSEVGEFISDNISKHQADDYGILI